MAALPAKRLGEDTRYRQLVAQWDWSRFIAASAVGIDRTGMRDPRHHGLVEGVEAELCQEAARGSPEGHNPFAPRVPWEVFQRDISVAASGGSSLLESHVAPVVELLRPSSVVIAAGAQVETGLSAPTQIPKETTRPVAYWLSSETTQTTESTPVLGEIPVNAHMCGTTLDVSRLLRLQGSGLNQYLSSTMMTVIGAAVDLATIAGSGAAGQPQGLVGTSGVTTASGATIAMSHLLTTRETLATANVNDDAVAWIATPAVRTTLAGRVRLATYGNGYLWEADTLADGRRGYVSSQVPTGDMICGDFSQITVAFFGNGPQIEVTQANTAQHFTQGITTMRVLTALDVAVRRTEAFYTLTSIS